MKYDYTVFSVQKAKRKDRERDLKIQWVWLDDTMSGADQTIHIMKETMATEYNRWHEEGMGYELMVYEWENNESLRHVS